MNEETTHTQITENNTSTIFTMFVGFQNSSDKIETKEFLKSSANVVTLIEKFGKAFSPVTYDINGNIQKLTRKYEEDTDSNKFLEDMIHKEQAFGEGLATDALLWLKRGLDFISNIFQMVIQDSHTEQPSNDLSPFLKKAYAATLEPYHGWLGSQLFNVLSRFMPTRRQLMYTFALDRHNHDEFVMRDLQKFNEGLTTVVQRLTQLYNDFDL